MSFFVLITGQHFKPGKWTKICSLHFSPSDFYNSYRTLREDAVPSIYPFITKMRTARRQLIRIGCDEFSVQQCGSEDTNDDPEATDEAESSSCNVEDSVEEQR